MNCRSDVAKAQIKEAVNCYQAGAYRSAIIATWIAILFDYISKLRELEMSGDRKARLRLETLQRARESGDIAASLEFERTLITEAREEYELISEIEATDLERLLEDRNRCAHSTMHSSDEPYSPSAELVRSHIKIAVTAFLQHPPVQGKAALDRLFQDVKSEYFPTDREQAYIYLKSGPLARARKPLIRSLSIGITKDLLNEVRPQQERSRQFAALNAAERLYPSEFRSALAEVLPGAMAAIKDEDFHLVIRYIRQINSAWSAMGQSAQIRAVTSLQSAPPDILMKFIGPALQSEQLRQHAAARIKDLSLEQIGPMTKFAPDDVFIQQLLVEQGVKLLLDARSFRTAETVLELMLVPLAPRLSSAALSQIIDACENNSQVSYAFRVPSLLSEIVTNSKLEDEMSRISWERLHRLATSAHFQREPNVALAESLQGRFGFKSVLPPSTASATIGDDEIPPF